MQLGDQNQLRPAMSNISPEAAEIKAHELVTAGFFEKRGTRDASEYWVPFLYRDALEMVQGAAESVSEKSCA